MIPEVVWAEKYRPKSLNDVIGQEHVVDRLRVFVEEKNMPHCLFAGRAGIGKTASALALANDLFVDNWRQYTLELNASDERGIDVIRHKVKDFARTKALGEVPFKMIILDEADALTRDAQQALRRTMESFVQTARFILICNYSSKIIEPIQSRCAVFRFKPLAELEIKEYVDRMVKGEKLEVSDDGFKALMESSEGDLRKVANLIQASAGLVKRITEDIVYEVASQARPTDVKEMLDLALKGDFKKAREKLHDMMLKRGLAGEDVVKQIHRKVYELKISERKKVELIEKVGEYDFRIAEGGSPLIQLTALLAQFLSIKRKK